MHSVYKFPGVFPQIQNMQEALAIVSRHHIKSEIIGEWLYCFTTPLIGFQLDYIGFWYSFKHCAWVYSGTEKDDTPADSESLDEIRHRLGSQRVVS